MQDEKKIKIIYAVTKGVWGGAQKYVFELATKLPKGKFDVSIVHGFGDILPNKLEEYDIPSFNIKDLGRDVNFIKDIRSFFKLYHHFYKNRPDIVHLNSSKIGGLGALAARLAGVKKIFFTIHGFAFNENRPVFQRWIIGLLSWLSMMFCTDIIFISDIEKKRVANWPLVKNKVHLVHNGINIPKYLTQTEARKEIGDILSLSENIFENKIVIGSVGEMIKNKGFAYSIQAVRNLKDCIYIIIGDGEEQNKLETLADFQNEGRIKKIFFTGFLQNAAHYMKAFDIFIQPSLKEGMPYTILEAGLANLPVITTRVGGIPEVIENDKNGILISPKNIEEISEALKNLIDKPHIRELLGTNLRKDVEEKFSLERMVRETVVLYNC